MDTKLKLLRCVNKEYDFDHLTVGNIYEGEENGKDFYRITELDNGFRSINKFKWKFEEVTYPETDQPDADLSPQVEASENKKVFTWEQQFQGREFDPFPQAEQDALVVTQTGDHLKKDGGKSPLGLIPYSAVKAEADVLAFGAKKYATHGWREGMAWSRLLDAALRHVQAYNDGEDRDPETGLLHLAHAKCCMSFLIEYATHGLGNDDRYKREYC